MLVLNIKTPDFVSKTCLLISIIGCSFISANAQTISEWEDIGPYGFYYGARVIASPIHENEAFLISEYQVLKTEDYGKNWVKTSADLLPREDLYNNSRTRLVFNKLNENEIYLVAGDIYKSIDKGLSWELLLSQNEYFAVSIDPNDPNYILSTSKGKLYESRNGGENWESLVESLKYWDPDSKELGDFLFRGDFYEFWVNPYFPEMIFSKKVISYGDVIDYGNFHYTNDTGISWDSLDIGGYDNTTRIEYVAEEIVFSTESKATFYMKDGITDDWFRTVNGGEAWVSISDSLKEEVDGSDYIEHLTISPLNPEILYLTREITARESHLYISRDSGKSWELQHSFKGIRGITSTAISPVNSNVGYLVTSPTSIFANTNLSSFDQKDNWIEGSHKVPYTSVDYLKSGVGGRIYAGIQGTGVFALDDEDEWYRASIFYPSGPYEVVPSKSIPDLVFGMVVTEENDELSYNYGKSTDGARNWELYPPGTYVEQFFDVASDNMTIYTTSSSRSEAGDIIGSIKVSSDEGSTWTELEIDITENDSSFINSIGFIKVDPENKNVVYAIAHIRGLDNRNVTIRSLDKGNTWDIISDGRKVFIDPSKASRIYVSKLDGKMYRSEDYGDNWTFVDSLGSITAMQIDPDDGNILYASNFDKIFMSVDGGENWEVLLQRKYFGNSLGHLALNKVDENTSELYVGTRREGVKRLKINRTPTSTEESGLNPKTFTLHQNYPNPFNPSTIIRFDLPEQSKVSVKVYDITGRLVVTLVNDVRIAGIHQVNFDASGLASGVYLYELKTNNFRSIKKFTLIK